MAWIDHDYSELDILHAELVARLERACTAAMAERGQVFMALAGGRTPLPIYARLAESHRHFSAFVLPSDERCVAHDHPACNARNLRAAFANDARFQVQDLGLADDSADASLKHARDLLARHPQVFDVVLLGMGNDGHFASLFPGVRELDAGLALDHAPDAVAITPDPLPPEAPFVRISLSLSRLLRAREIHLVVTGDEKRGVLRRAKREPMGALPVSHLLHAPHATIHLHWSP